MPIGLTGTTGIRITKQIADRRIAANSGLVTVAAIARAGGGRESVGDSINWSDVPKRTGELRHVEALSGK
jgi:hypothetical protein